MWSVMSHGSLHGAGELNLNIRRQRAEGISDGSYITARYPQCRCMEILDDRLWLALREDGQIATSAQLSASGSQGLGLATNRDISRSYL
jgi:hypothetical protein